MKRTIWVLMVVAGCLCGRPASAGIAQVASVAGGLAVLQHYSDPELRPGDVLRVTKLFVMGKVAAPAEIVSVDRIATTARIRFTGPAANAPIGAGDYVQVEVVHPGVAAAPAADKRKAPTQQKTPGGAGPLTPLRFPLDVVR